MKMLLISAVALVAANSQVSFAQTLTPDQPAQRSIERRAVEAVNWGMSAVNYDLMLQEMLTKTSGRVNQIIYWSRPLDWHNQTLTPNPDAIYFMAFFNTKIGPIVVEVPPADGDGSLNANFVDVWQIRGRRAVRGRQRRGSEILGPAARFRRCRSRRLHAASAGYVRQLRTAALEPRKPRHCRCCQVGRIWQADQGLSARASRQSPADDIHRRRGREFDPA